MIINNAHIGCSSYANRSWTGVFYPEELTSKQMFEYYCTQFDTFEINATFYKTPTTRVMQNWFDRSPAEFVYSVKAPKTITHINKFIDCENEIANFYEVCKKGLREKLGCILFQLPPSYSYSDERLETILTQLDANYDNVVEFRHASWWIPSVYEAFQYAGVTFCNVSYPNLPSTFVSTSKVAFVRLHGVPKLFYSEYSDYELSVVVNQLTTLDFEKVFIYFNNTAGVAGAPDALALKELLNAHKILN